MKCDACGNDSEQGNKHEYVTGFQSTATRVGSSLGADLYQVENRAYHQIAIWICSHCRAKTVRRFATVGLVMSGLGAFIMSLLSGDIAWRLVTSQELEGMSGTVAFFIVLSCLFALFLTYGFFRNRQNSDATGFPARFVRWFMPDTEERARDLMLLKMNEFGDQRWWFKEEWSE